MIVVSDTTPLRHLIAIGEADLLQHLFGSVIIPAAVLSELRADSTPAAVKSWIDKRPDWLEARNVSHAEIEEAGHWLDAGEREAIELALELRPDFILLDERRGREFAAGRGLPVTGTLGVLERADLTGLIRDFPATIERLRASGFYLSDRLQESLLDRHLRRQRF